MLPQVPENLVMRFPFIITLLLIAVMFGAKQETEKFLEEPLES